MAQDDDSFGLPDINFKPLETKQQTPPPAQPKVVKKPEVKSSGKVQTPASPTRLGARPGEVEEEGLSSTKVILGIAIPILLLVGGYFGYKYLYKIPKAKAASVAAAKEKIEKDRKEKEEAARLAKLKEEEEARLKAAEANAKPTIGNMETLLAATGRFYVIVASSIDDDLLNDLAQKMSAKGVSTKIIPPFGKWKYFRLTISDHDTFTLAQASAIEAKAEYPSGTWVMKY